VNIDEDAVSISIPSLSTIVCLVVGNIFEKVLSERIAPKDP